MRSEKFILDGHKPKPVEDLLEWGRWFQTAERHVGKDDIGKVHISTVFLGMDHNFDVGPPILFETMIFGGEHDGYQERYYTWDEAEAGHQMALKLVTDSMKAKA